MKVFISHSTQDRDWAKYLAGHLNRAGYDVWLPDDQILPGDNFALRIGEALERSDAMIVLLSPDAVESQWVRQEINFALGSPRYANRVIPVFVESTENFPWILRKLRSVPVSQDRDEVGRQVVDQLQRIGHDD